MCNSWIWIILLLCCCNNGSCNGYNNYNGCKNGCNNGCGGCGTMRRDCDCGCGCNDSCIQPRSNNYHDHDCGCDNDRISRGPIAPFAPKCDCDD